MSLWSPKTTAGTQTIKARSDLISPMSRRIDFRIDPTRAQRRTRDSCGYRYEHPESTVDTVTISGTLSLVVSVGVAVALTIIITCKSLNKRKFNLRNVTVYKNIDNWVPLTVAGWSWRINPTCSPGSNQSYSCLLEITRQLACSAVFPTQFCQQKYPISSA